LLGLLTLGVAVALEDDLGATIGTNFESVLVAVEVTDDGARSVPG